MGQTGAAGGAPQTPWAQDEDAAGFNLKNVHDVGFKTSGQLPTFINVVANLGVSFQIAGVGSDTYSTLLLAFGAGFAGAAADTTLFEVQLFATHSGQQAVAFINPINAASLVPQFYTILGSVGLGFGSFKVVNHVALAAGSQSYNIAYYCPGG